MIGPNSVSHTLTIRDMCEVIASTQKQSPEVGDRSVSASLSDRVDLLRVVALERLDTTRRAEMGQFMTPPAVASFMASLFNPLPEAVRLLDARAGIGTLTAAFAEDVCHRSARPKRIEATVYELDPVLSEYLELALRETRNLCNQHNIEMAGELRQWNGSLLVEAVTSHGPGDAKRRDELARLFKGARPGIVRVTAFPNRRDMAKYASEISWVTEVWVAESETHRIHFDSEHFLGPYVD